MGTQYVKGLDETTVINDSDGSTNRVTEDYPDEDQRPEVHELHNGRATAHFPRNDPRDQPPPVVRWAENQERWVENEGRLVENQGRLVENKERLVENQEHLVENQEYLVENQEHLVENQERLVENEERLVENQEHLVENQEHLVENQERLVENEERLVENEEHLVENQGRLVENEEHLVEKEHRAENKRQWVYDKDHWLVEVKEHEAPVAWSSNRDFDVEPPPCDFVEAPVAVETTQGGEEPPPSDFVEAPAAVETTQEGEELPLLECETPDELVNCKLDELQALCEEYGINPVARSKLQLIARLLPMFPHDTVTEATLDKFSTRQLRRLAEVLNLPFFSQSKAELIKAILTYHRSTERSEPSEKDFATDEEDSVQEVSMSPETPTRNSSREKKKLVQRTLSDFPLSSRKRSRLTYDEEPAEGSTEQPNKKRRITSDTFMDFSSPLTLMLHNRSYSVFPTLLEGSKMGWSRDGRQQMNVQGRPVTVKWSLKASIVKVPGEQQPTRYPVTDEDFWVVEGAGVGLDRAETRQSCNGVGKDVAATDENE